MAKQNPQKRKRQDPSDAIPEPNLGPDWDLIAIDPGDRWTGVAFFTRHEDGWECVDAQEFEPPQAFEDALAETLLTPDYPPETPPLTVVYEKWRLYGDHAKEKTGSEFDTSQHIGVIKFIVRTAQTHFEKHVKAKLDGKFLTCEVNHGMCLDPKKQMRAVELVKQPADIKKPTRGILNKKKIKSVARPIAKELYGNRDHVVDAELHGWHHILRTLGEGPAPS